MANFQSFVRVLPGNRKGLERIEMAPKTGQTAQVYRLNPVFGRLGSGA